MFSLLSQQSVLRHGMGGEGFDPEAFTQGLTDAMDRPDRISARLFTLRAEGLLNGLVPDAARARLSGLLIGLELAAAKPYWLGQRIALIGAESLAASYASALSLQGQTTEILDATACTLAGLAAANGQLQKVTA
jgi:2-dehydro-3-deoxygalactonokinase